MATDEKKTTEENEVEEILFTEEQVKSLIRDAVDVALKDYIARTETPNLGQNGVLNPAQLAAAKSGVEVIVTDKKKSLPARIWDGITSFVSEHPILTTAAAAGIGIAAKTAWDNRADNNTDGVALPTDDNTFGGYMPQ